MNNIVKIFTALVVMILTANTLIAEQSKWCSEGKAVKIGGATWDSQAFYTELARYMISEGYDCEVSVITGSKNVTESALVSGDLHILMEIWSGQDAILMKGEEAGKVKKIGDILNGGTLEAWFVPDYLVHGDAERGIKALAPDLKSISDLPKYKDLFTDPESPDKGRFLNCPTGWECEKTNTQRLKAFKLNEYFTNFRPGTGGALDAEITSAVTRGKPIVFYYWSPSSILGKFNFYKLEEPAYNEKCFATLFNTTTDDACPSAYPVTTLVNAVSTEFYNQAPVIVEFLSTLQMKYETLNQLLAVIGDKKVSVEQAVVNFLKENPDIWKSWVPADASKKIEASL